MEHIKTQKTILSHFPVIAVWFVLLLLPSVLHAQPGGAFVLETKQLRVEIEEDGCLAHVIARHDGVDYAAGGVPCPLAVAYRGGRLSPVDEGPYAATGRWGYRGGSRFVATNASLRGDVMTVQFGAAKAKAVYRVRRTDDYLAFELTAVEGEPLDRIEFFRLSVRNLPWLGQWVNVAGDERFGVCLCGGSLQTDIEMLPQKQHVLMTAAADAEVGYRGAAAVLFGCREPKKQFLEVMARVENDFHLPAGAARRCSPRQRHSYLWASRPTPKNINQYVRLAKQGGFRVLMLSYRAFAKGAGHFQWNDDYPNGMADLKRVTDAVRAAGLTLGLHIHYSKVEKNDPYVTPVPDDRLRKVRSFSLAAPLDVDSTVLVVKENPAGSTLDKGRRLLKLGKELVEYDGYTQARPFQFTGCRRGALGTKAAAHTVGTQCGLLDVDTWPVFIRLDQNTDIQDEVARRIADIYRQTGPYKLIYFDGAEDVHEPFWYHVPSSQQRVYRLLDPPPVVCEAAHNTHFSWHMMTRSNAYDIVASPDGMKDFCRLMPCPSAAARAMDFSRVDFGWLACGRGKSGFPGPDVFEYIASRAAAWDCPLSLNTTPEQVHSNPRGKDCLATIKVWEEARLGNHLSQSDLRPLRNVAPMDAHFVSCYQQRTTYQKCRENRDLADWQRRILADRREHHLFVNEQGRYEIVEIEAVANVARDEVKAYLFSRAGKPECVYALVWAVEGERLLRLPRGRLSAMRPFGKQAPCESGADFSKVLVGPRTYLFFSGTTRESASQLLRQAVVVHRDATRDSVYPSQR